MLKKLTAFLFVICFASMFGQSTQTATDIDQPFVVNPTPHIIQPFTDVPVEEIIALNQNMFGAGPRTRGNIFECTINNWLVEHRLYLNPNSVTNMTFVVYEGMAAVGIFDAISVEDVSPQGPGEGWYSSGAIQVPLVAGRHYMLVAGFEQVTNYWNENPVAVWPYPVAFGFVTAGAGWNYAPGGLVYPPAMQEDVPATAYGDPVAYYQTIVTDLEVPVELMSFTFSVSENDVTLNWNTASETNNLGFEVQRKTSNGEFAAIGFINGYGTTTEPQQYTFIDENLAPGAYTYRLKQVDIDGSEYFYDELTAEIANPTEFTLQQNYPNPFNPSTQIDFSLAVDSKVTLNVYSLLGEKVATLVNSNLTAGVHQINFDASNLNSGVYFYRIEATADGFNFNEVRKMLLTK